MAQPLPAPVLAAASTRGGGRLSVVIAGGGTGGHTSAGLAIAAALRARLGDAIEVHWIGSHTGLEAQRAPAAGIAFHPIATGKLRRRATLRNLSDLGGRVPAGVGQAWALLRRLRPDVVVATGGFVAVPTAIAAAIRRRPLLVHEQVAVPGLANRLLARFADRIAVTFTASAAAFPDAKVVWTGNPVRPELLAGDAARAVRRFDLDPAWPLVYVTGGAQGSHRINRAVGAVLESLLAVCQIVHQCGHNEFNDAGWLLHQAEQLPPALRARYGVVPFVTEGLGDLYAAARLAIGRAGAGTVTELAAVGLPAILIPLPEARGDEQTANARVLADAGAAILALQHELTPDGLADLVRSLLADPPRLRAMAARARSVGLPDAADRLVDLILELAHRR
jgi:UDP-N-acetylglucosamine--N-acetylmuramyl-(pentapeptide) pyrophosphoryl-undecaprenol N-acetylglucosamine transferase